MNCLTGELIYFDRFDTMERLFDVCQAANSMPLICKVKEIDGIPMLDGGMAEAIPIGKALEEGWKKIVVVFTRDASYRKKPSGAWYRAANWLLYRQYPKFRALIPERHKRYNASIEQIAELERQGRAFVLRPSGMTVHNSESDADVLLKYYQHGIDVARGRMEELKRFLES